MYRYNRGLFANNHRTNKRERTVAQKSENRNRMNRFFCSKESVVEHSFAFVNKLLENERKSNLELLCVGDFCPSKKLYVYCYECIVRRLAWHLCQNPVVTKRSPIHENPLSFGIRTPRQRSICYEMNVCVCALYVTTLCVYGSVLSRCLAELYVSLLVELLHVVLVNDMWFCCCCFTLRNFQRSRPLRIQT